MIYLVLLLACVLYVFGLQRSTDIATFLREPTHLRNLAFRIAGFVAMSAWLHLLPLLMMTIYMRQEGFLATEVLVEDHVRAWVVGLYMSSVFLTVIWLGCIGPITAAVEGSAWRLRSWPSLLGLLAALSPGILLLARGSNVGPYLFVLAASLPFIIYITVTLATPLVSQVRLWWLPFAVIAAESIFLIQAPTWVHKFVAKELAEFGAGGGRFALVKYKDSEVVGRAVLATKEAVYIRLGGKDDWQSARCLVRVPINDAVYVVDLMGSAAKEIARRDTDRTDILDFLAIESDRKFCRSDVLAEEGPAVEANPSSSPASSSATASQTASAPRPQAPHSSSAAGRAAK